MLKPFLNHYDTILLDMDGVITSEQVYWNAAALTVWELLFSRHYFGTEDINPEALMTALPEIRRQLFQDDAVIRLLKNKGVNNNWDLAWAVVGGLLLLGKGNEPAVYDWLASLPDVAGGFYAAVGDGIHSAGLPKEEAAHHGGLWNTIQLAFQEWFLGSELLPLHWNSPSLQPGKPGLTFSEEPIVDKAKLTVLLGELGSRKRLGIGSGRPRVEAETPLEAWNVLSCFTEDAIVTYNEVLNAQNQLAQPIALTKPHPYMFLRGVFGDAVSDIDLLNGNYDVKPCKKTLVIGDAGCDLFAAKSAGCDFAAVLTGIEGENARGYFEENGADYILHNILELLES